MTRFARLDRIAGKAVDRLYAEPFVLTPMTTDPNGRPRPDADRAVMNGNGVFELRETKLEVGDRRSVRTVAPVRTMAPAKTPTLGVARDQFADPPRQGDVIDLPERGEVYEIVYGQPDHSRLLLVLTRQGGRPKDA